ncbi:contactin-associated protein-like 4 [Solea senegalensis]|uniref:Contactin-associated protein-like 4 n=2 Tax=Solea senegalensis TaxID=28829 RepID=A0AAV6S4H1_SOLSE|nr:contactin-associated protein-like 4 [Solea senegalensis]
MGCIRLICYAICVLQDSSPWPDLLLDYMVTDRRSSSNFIMDVWSKKLPGIITQVALILFSSCGVTGGEVCHSPLVSNLLPSSFRSSSQLSGSHGPGFAKLNRREGAGGWSPLSSDRYQWLEVDLGLRTEIAAVATQGRYGSSDWLTAYLLMFSDTGHNWKQYRQEDNIGAFPGNTNADSVVQHKLQHRVTARYVRLIPLDWNRNGRIGLRLETYGCPYNSDVVSFDGHSSLLYRLSPRLRQMFRESVSLKFKTLRNSGTLLHAEGRNEHSLTLELERGKLLFILRKGQVSSPDSQHLVSLGSLLDDQHWHHVAVEHHSDHLNFTVDKNTVWLQIPASFSHWNHDQMIVGSDRVLSSWRSVGSNRNFCGCLENIIYNGVNLVDLAKQRDQRVTVKGNVTFSCVEPIFVAMTFTGPQSFLWLPRVTEAWTMGMTVGLQFRTWNKAGLLLTFELPHQGGAAWLYLSKAVVYLQIHKPGRAPLELNTGSALNDGQWHSVLLISRRGHLTISVDGDEGTTAHASPAFDVTSAQLVFGGCPTDGSSQECMNPFKVFQGCMRLLTVDHQQVDLIKVQQRLIGNYSHLLIDMCGIIDRCSPNHCEHGGSCSQSWSTFHCNCSSTSYSGATCHSSIYEQSCEAYKHKGKTSGYYYIDVDGSGPIGPQLIYCNMTEDKTWMVIQHNNTELTRVRPSQGKTQHSAHFEYASEEKQLAAIISQSEHCEQELTYHCRKSRLLHTPDGSLLSWWVGGLGEGQIQTYWGGAPPGSQQCACSLQENCVDPRHHCNCDADHMDWANDSGLLTHKENLPVRALVLGDVQRPGSETAYRVGPLRCHGDKNVWNAAFFDKETSYLHFPTFHAELSADISFLFKTTSSSGVFLENLGIKDFIRIEMSSSTEVLFSLDVGNGPLEVTVKADFPLNDNRWHHIRAERNIKEVSLRLDELPGASQKAPADGHIHLQLNSQLFIGGTASRQKGFRGCIRALQLNGVTLDLEERAKITPGVQAGCPGHCSSYGSLCQNQGLCVERPNSFSCDCGSSAYTGAFCDREVSASFKSGTSISYTFKEQVVNVLNRSSSVVASSVHSDMTLRAENISLSFRTSQSPALILYVGSYHREYLALLLNKHDKLEVRYRLDSSRDAEVLRSNVKRLASGHLHTVTLCRLADAVSMQIDQNPKEEFNLTSDVEFNGIRLMVLGRLYNSGEMDPELAQLSSLGFIGCLSAVLFNSISPLKAALLHPDTSPVIVTGPLVQSICGSMSANPYAAETTHLQSGQSESVGTGEPLVNAIRSDSALIGGVIAVVIFVTLSALAIMGRLLYRRQRMFQSPEIKTVKAENSPELPFSSQTSSHSGPSENQKEYFI